MQYPHLALCIATEVALELPYNAMCDVYSFAILFWEMFALQKPFGLLNSDVLLKFVVNGETRPPIPDKSFWPTPLKNMLIRCWSKNVSARLAMTAVTSILMAEIGRVRGI